MAIVDGEKRLTLLDLYNNITGQAWSMFDSEVEDEDEFEQSVMTSIRKALSDLWNSYKFPFRERTHVIMTKPKTNNYATPNGMLESNVMQKVVKGKQCYCVFCNSKPLKYDPDCQFEETKEGKPESFYFKQNKIYLYPVPDSKYIVTIDYLTIYPVLNEDGDEKLTLENEDDYINIPENCQELFECTLMPLAMWKYLITDESDENSEGYKIQYERAYNRLLQNMRPIGYEKCIGWGAK